MPKNPDNPFYDIPLEFNPDDAVFVDLGLGANLDVMQASENGKFSVPTLRNVSLTAPYMHNGAFQTLEQRGIIFQYARCVATLSLRFYQSRLLVSPKVVGNVDTLLLENLGLTDHEVTDIIAFLQTLTDGYVLPPP